ncbi:hypothetical protein HispidOSU_004201 [Sigmodon hispidus]
MTTLHTRKDPLLGGVAPTPSKIPVLSQRCSDFSSVKSCSVDQENQDPRRLTQKPPFSTQRPLIDSAGLRSKTLHQTEISQRLGTTQLRNPLEELKLSPGGPNDGLVPHPQTEAKGAIEFVADPAALATILSGEGVKSCHLGRQSSLAQRVLVRGNKGGTTLRGQSTRSSAYLVPKTPIHQADPARASCFSRLEGSGPRGRTLCPQRLEALNPPSRPSFLQFSTRPSLQELRREMCGNSRISASQTSRLLPKTPVQSASLPLTEEHEVAPPSGEGGRTLLGLAQRVPLRETRSAYSSLKRFTTRTKTQFTPLQSLPRVQQAQQLSGPSPHSSPEEPALPWEQIAVRLFDQESCIALQKGSRKPPVTSTSGTHPNKTPNLQELKMQRILVLQQLLEREMKDLAVGKCAPLNGGSPLEMAKLQPPLADISRTLNAPEHNSGTSLLGLPKHSGVTEPYPVDENEKPQPCPGEETKEIQTSSATEPEPPVPCWIAGPEPPKPCLPVLPSSQGQAGPLEACPSIELGPSAGCSLGARNPESIPQPCCSQGTPANTSLTFSSQSSLCASPPIHSLQSLRSPTGQSGPSSLAPRTLALRQRLKACLTAIRCFYEARLDDECAFYTSRPPPPGPTRVCTNPVATLLEWQEALCFIPVGSVVPRDSPS